MTDTKKKAAAAEDEPVQKDVAGTIPSDRERGDSAADLIRKAGGVVPEELQTESDDDVKEKKEISKPGTITTKGKEK